MFDVASDVVMSVLVPAFADVAVLESEVSAPMTLSVKKRETVRLTDFSLCS
jgi:hypothetical protein